MSEKLRVDGETIDPNKTYSGRRVLELIKVSFNNGIFHANRDIIHDRQEAYARGYQDGRRDADNDIKTLRRLLRKLIMEDTADE